MRNVKPCANWQCGCSGKSLRTRTGAIDRMVDAAQASQRVYSAKVQDTERGIRRLEALKSMVKRYDRVTDA